MNKKQFFLINLIVLASMVLGACVPPTPVPAAATGTAAPQAAANASDTLAPSPTAQPAAAQPTAAQASQPTVAPAASGPKIMVANLELQSTWVRNFNPFSPNARTVTGTIMYEPMMIYNKMVGKLVPWLADSYTWSGDNKTLTFKLHPNVLWSDGQPFSAKDVVYTFNLIKGNAALASTVSNDLATYISAIAAPDDQTVVFTFSEVFTPALSDLAGQIIIPEHIWKDVKDPVTYTNENPVATGPFTEITKFQDQDFVVGKNPHYWQPGKPYFDGIDNPAYPGNDQANMAMVNGQMDWAGNFVPDIDKTWVSKNPTDFHYWFPGGDAVLLFINTDIKPLDNPEVRKAISMGIDRDSIINVAEYGYTTAMDDTGIGDQFKDWKDPSLKSTWTKFDPQAANDALDKAGIKKNAAGMRLAPDGKPMKYELIVPSGWTDWIATAQIISQNMKDLGIEVDVNTPEQDTWTDKLSKKQYQWALNGATGGTTPYYFYRGQMSKQTVAKAGESASDNYNRYVDPDADKLLSQFAVTSDLAQQKALMYQIEAIYVKDAPTLPLFPGPDWYEYVTTHYTDFPTKDNPYVTGSPYSSPAGAGNTLILVTTVKPK